MPKQETRVQCLGREDPLEKEMATHSSILAWRIPWAEEPGGLQLMGCKELDSTEQLTHTQIYINVLNYKHLGLSWRLSGKESTSLRIQESRV